MADEDDKNDLTDLQADSSGGIGLQLELTLESLEKKLDDVITERTDLTHALNTLVQEIAVIDGELATRTAEITERTANLLDVGAVITKLKEKACAYSLEIEQVKEDVEKKVEEQKKSFMDGKNRLERVRGALLDLYAEQLVLKASFLAYAGSLKGVSHKVRITREMNDQTHYMLREIPPMKAALQGLRDRISAFKTQTAEDSVRLHDRIVAEREQRITEAKEQKYLVQLYDEESHILDRLDADLKLQLDSALEVAVKLQQELKDHETYFKHLAQRLPVVLKAERSGAAAVFSKLMKRSKPAGSPLQSTANKSSNLLARLCPFCGTVGKYCPTCNLSSVKTLVPGVKKKPPLQDALIDLDNRRSAMKAQLKYMEHKIQQLEIEVYISKMNVEIQMLQTSIKIEGWKKTGYVPTSMQVSAVDTSLETTVAKMRPMLSAFGQAAAASGKSAKGKTRMMGMAGVTAALTLAHRTPTEAGPKLPTFSPAVQ